MMLLVAGVETSYSGETVSPVSPDQYDRNSWVCVRGGGGGGGTVPPSASRRAIAPIQAASRHLKPGNPLSARAGPDVWAVHAMRALRGLDAALGRIPLRDHPPL